MGTAISFEKPKGWLKYQPELPRDFLYLIENLLL